MCRAPISQRTPASAVPILKRRLIAVPRAAYAPLRLLQRTAHAALAPAAFALAAAAAFALAAASFSLAAAAFALAAASFSLAAASFSLAAFPLAPAALAAPARVQLRRGLWLRRFGWSETRLVGDFGSELDCAVAVRNQYPLAIGASYATLWFGCFAEFGMFIKH